MIVISHAPRDGASPCPSAAKKSLLLMLMLLLLMLLLLVPVTVVASVDGDNNDVDDNDDGDGDSTTASTGSGTNTVFTKNTAWACAWGLLALLSSPLVIDIIDTSEIAGA